jgi:heptaprenyl diphosphate synthase
VTNRSAQATQDRLRLAEFDPALDVAVGHRLAEVESLMRQAIASDVAQISDSAKHLIDAGGKRIRPLFCLLASEFGTPPPGGAGGPVIVAAAAVELVHLATLYHDDVVDEATIRRGAASANARWDNTIAILTGDFLFAHASRLVSVLGPDATRIIAETFSELVTGEMRETIGPSTATGGVEHYLSVIEQKTGSLIATAARFGGMYSGAEALHTDALRSFGAAIGAAFQISDDIIDIASPTLTSGKDPGTDLREGVRTLPVLYMLGEASPEGERLRALLGAEHPDGERLGEALELLRGSEALRRSRATLEEYATRAAAQLDVLPDCPAKEALRALTEYVVARTG